MYIDQKRSQILNLESALVEKCTQKPILKYRCLKIQATN